MLGVTILYKELQLTSAVCAQNKDIQSVAAISIFFRPCQRLQAIAWTKTTAVRLGRYSSNKTGTKEIAVSEEEAFIRKEVGVFMTKKNKICNFFFQE